MTKSPTQKEKIKVYEELMHDIQFHADVTGRLDVVQALVRKMCNWSYAHRAGNGELSTKEQQAQVDKAFWDLSRENRK